MARLLEDRELLNAYRRGDRSALEEVYREYAQRLFAFLAKGFTYQSQGASCVFRGYREPWELEEAVQEVFVRAFAPGARNAYDGLRPFRNYLFTIARNLVIDRFRRAGREVIAEQDDLADRAPPDPNEAGAQRDPEHAAADRELAQHVEAFVQALDRDEREVFTQRFREQRSIEAVARQLSMTEHRVKRLERRIKKRFFVEMRRRGFFRGYRYAGAGLERSLLMLMLYARVCP